MLKCLFLTISLLFGVKLYSDISASQTIVIEVETVTEFTLKGADPMMKVPLALAPRKGKVKRIHSGISYSFTCPDDCTKKIVGQLDRPTPNGLKINVYLSPPPGAITTGFQTLRPIETDLVKNIRGSDKTNNTQIIYEVIIDETFENYSVYERKVVFTFLDQ